MNKGLKRNFIIIISVMVVIITSIIFVARQKNEIKVSKDAIGLYHVWTVYFQNEISNEDYNNTIITVKDNKGTNLNVLKMTDNGMKKIYVYPPEGGYKNGVNYSIEVNSKKAFTLQQNKDNVTSIKFKPQRTYKNTEVKFKDKNLEKVVREQIGKEDSKLYMYDVEGITSIIANGMNIKDISGIEQLYNLRELYLDVNDIKDIKPLSKLNNLECLGLSYNKITDISAIKDLNLYQLSLNGNNIKDYSPIKDVYKKLEWKDFDIK